jgi:hypothetical protein
MLDQLRHVSPAWLANTDLRNLARGVVAVAAKLGDGHWEESGKPRASMLVRDTLGAIERAAECG